MSRARLQRATLGAAAFLVVAAPAARADDAPQIDRIWEEMSGEIRAGWRFLRGEGEGRFFQDQSLEDGPRIFDLDLRGRTLREDAAVSSIEATAHGIGEQESDYRLRLVGQDTWKLEGGYASDDFSYRSTGDPFPYDTQRTRSDLRFRYTPSNRLTVRLDWDRSVRRGDAYLAAQTLIRDSAPPGIDADITGDRRPLSQKSDRLTLGVDAAFDGGFRVSLAESMRLLQIDDTRVYEIPRALRGATPVFEALRRDVRSPAWTTTAKAGWTSPTRTLDVQAIFSYTLQPLDSDVSGNAHGYDGAYDAGGAAPKGEFSETTTGSNDVHRDAVDARIEATWRPLRDWEFTAALAQESIVDDASLRLTKRRTYSRTVPDAVPDSITTTSTDARITNRLRRASIEAEWQIRENLRLRLGDEYLEEELSSPTDTRGAETFPPVHTDFTSTSWRATVGADWEPVDKLDLSLLLRHGGNDDPHAATSFDVADEVIFRGRWKASDDLSLTSVWRHKGFRQDSDYDSASRSDSVSVGATWTHGDLTVTPNVTYQFMDTRTDTQFYDYTVGFTPITDQVSYVTRDVIASLDLRYAFTKTLRGFLTATWIQAGGDYDAQWDDASLGAEVDLRDNVTLGAALKSWRLDEQDLHADDYRVVGAEVWVTLRF